MVHQHDEERERRPESSGESLAATAGRCRCCSVCMLGGVCVGVMGVRVVMVLLMEGGVTGES